MIINEYLFLFFSVLNLIFLIYALCFAFTLGLRSMWHFKGDSDPLRAWKVKQRKEGRTVYQMVEDSKEQERVERSGWVSGIDD